MRRGCQTGNEAIAQSPAVFYSTGVRPGPPRPPQIGRDTVDTSRAAHRRPEGFSLFWQRESVNGVIPSLPGPEPAFSGRRKKGCRQQGMRESVDVKAQVPERRLR
jgi:hypothetical protein